MEFNLRPEAAEIPNAVVQTPATEIGFQGSASETYITAQTSSALDHIGVAAEVAPPAEAQQPVRTPAQVWRPARESDQPRVQYPFTNASESGVTVRDSPTLPKALNDPGRDNPLAAWRSETSTRKHSQLEVAPENTEVVELTEAEALRELDQFFTTVQTELNGSDDPKALRLAEQAASMQKNMRFIGKQEFEEAAAGIADLWTAHLQDNRRNQLYVPTRLIRTGDLQNRKSSERLYDAVIANIDPGDQHRIVTDARNISLLRPAKGVLLDDWTLSGTHLNNGLADAHYELSRRWRDPIGDDFELHLITASDRQLAGRALQSREIPTYAYFDGGKDAGGAVLQRGPVVTGSHSTADFSFEKPIEEMTAALNQRSHGERYFMPLLANLIRRG